MPRGRRDAFAFGVLVSAFATLLLLHVVDPDDAIVRTNATMTRAFDVRYAKNLGADAVPALLEVAPSLAPAPRAALAQALLERWSAPPEADWRTFSLARARARRAVGDAEPELRMMARGAGSAQITP